MTESHKQEILQKSSWLDNTKRHWTPDELKWAYRLYNEITKSNRKDTGCRSCRKQIVDFLKIKYKEITSQNNLNT